MAGQFNSEREEGLDLKNLTEPGSSIDPTRTRIGQPKGELIVDTSSIPSKDVFLSDFKTDIQAIASREFVNDVQNPIIRVLDGPKAQKLEIDYPSKKFPRSSFVVLAVADDAHNQELAAVVEVGFRRGQALVFATPCGRADGLGDKIANAINDKYQNPTLVNVPKAELVQDLLTDSVLSAWETYKALPSKSAKAAVCLAALVSAYYGTKSAYGVYVHEVNKSAVEGLAQNLGDIKKYPDIAPQLTKRFSPGDFYALGTQLASNDQGERQLAERTLRSYIPMTLPEAGLRAKYSSEVEFREALASRFTSEVRDSKDSSKIIYLELPGSSEFEGPMGRSDVYLGWVLDPALDAISSNDLPFQSRLSCASSLVSIFEDLTNRIPNFTNRTFSEDESEIHQLIHGWSPYENGRSKGTMTERIGSQLKQMAAETNSPTEIYAINQLSARLNSEASRVAGLDKESMRVRSLSFDAKEYYEEDLQQKVPGNSDVLKKREDLRAAKENMEKSLEKMEKDLVGLDNQLFKGSSERWSKGSKLKREIEAGEVKDSDPRMEPYKKAPLKP